MSKLIAGILAFLVVIVGVMLVTVVFAIPAGILVTLAWNAVIPQTFGFPSIDFFGGIGLAILTSLLLKSSPNPSGSTK